MGQSPSSSSSSSSTPPWSSTSSRPTLPSLPDKLSDINEEYLRKSARQTQKWFQYKVKNTKERVEVQVESLNRISNTPHLVNNEIAYSLREWRQRTDVIHSHPMQSAGAIAVGTGTGLLTFAASRFTCSFALHSLRVSSSNRIAATLGGLVTLGVSSNLAVQASLFTSNEVAKKYYHLRDWSFQPLHPAHPSFIPFSALVLTTSLLQFRLLGGRLKNLAPSDVMRPGSYSTSRHTIRAPSNDYADSRTKAIIHASGRENGCHSCGRSRAWVGFGRHLSFIGDHIPPNKYAKQADLASGATYLDTHGMPRGLWSRLWPFRPRKTKQDFYPQCERCSLIQSNAVRMDKRTLILPRSFRWHDIYLPFPLVTSLFFLPLLLSMLALLEEEQPRSERRLGVRPDRPEKGVWQKRIKKVLGEEEKGGWWKK